ERALEELGAGAGADHDGLAVGDRADVGGLREGLSVDHDLDRRRRLHALHRVPATILECRSGDQLAVARRSFEAARRLAPRLVLRLELATGRRVEALAD